MTLKPEDKDRAGKRRFEGEVWEAAWSRNNSGTDGWEFHRPTDHEQI
jgi:hypothetical protein